MTWTPRTGTINMFGTHISVWEDTVDEPAMRQVFRSLLARLLRRGWKLERDPETVKNWPRISPWYWIGRKGDLRMYAETGGRTAKVEFYQEINVHNPNGGRYDYGKFARMPSRLRGRCVVEMVAVVRRLLEHGYGPSSRHHRGGTIDTDNLLMSVLRLAEDKPEDDVLTAFNRGWNFASDWKRGKHRFERDAQGWPTVKAYDPYGHNRDRDGVPLRNGEVRYFRAHRHNGGRLMRGRIFTNMNEMWSVDTGCGRRYMHRSDLFHCGVWVRTEPPLDPDGGTYDRDWSAVSHLEVCAGRDGDDAYVILKKGIPLTERTLSALYDVFSTLRFAVECCAPNTERDKLQARVDELEEQLAAYQPPRRSL